ncbi:MAG: flagellar hook-associated protein FlgK [Candidatus Marinimicrobia bacterium]|nr:flagellar hook-associated protein FlgK [Candidatus Neomarinimicrobiota bacterium]
MGGIATLFELGRQGMMASQSGMQVAGTNITNVNTKGYSRQRLDVVPQLPQVLAGFNLGGSLNADNLRQIRDAFTDRQFRSQNSLKFQYQTEESVLSQLEGVMPADNEAGLRAMPAEFWDAWDRLSNDPENNVARDDIFNKADTMATTYRRIHREIVNLQGGIDDDIQASVAKINSLAQQLAKLNAADQGDNLNIIDHRNRLIDQLSEEVNIQFYMDGKNTAVTIGGVNLVGGVSSFDFRLERTADEQGVGQITLFMGNTKPIEVDVTSGILGGLIKVYNGDIRDILERMDTQVLAIVDQVNALHQTGYNLDDATGRDFFAAGILGAANFDIDTVIAGNHNLIASSDTPGETGNGGIARAISAIRDARIIGSETLGEHYRSMIANLGGRIQESTFLGNSQKKVVEHLELKRESVSGVSIEEEITLMMQLEQAFTAASRMVAMADELTRTLLRLF